MPRRSLRSATECRVLQMLAETALSAVAIGRAVGLSTDRVRELTRRAGVTRPGTPAKPPRPYSTAEQNVAADRRKLYAAARGAAAQKLAKMWSDGLTPKEIAGRLGVSETWARQLLVRRGFDLKAPRRLALSRQGVVFLGTGRRGLAAHYWRRT